jgi:hypothetical protein
MANQYDSLLNPQDPNRLTPTGFPQTALPPRGDTAIAQALTRSPVEKEQGFFSKLGPEGQHALFRSLLTAGTAIQRQSDPEGRHPSTQLFTGLETGLAAFDTIRKEQKKTKLAQLRQSRLAEVGAAGTPLQKASALADVGFQTDDPALAAKGLELSGKLTPPPVAEQKGFTLGEGETRFGPTGEQVAAVPAETKVEKKQPITINGVGYSFDPVQGTYSDPLTKEPVSLVKVGGDTRVFKPDEKGVLQEVIPKQEKPIILDVGNKTILYDPNTKEQKEFARGSRPPIAHSRGKVVTVKSQTKVNAFGDPITESKIEVPDASAKGGFRYLDVPTELFGPPAPQEPTINGEEVSVITNVKPGSPPFNKAYIDTILKANPPGTTLQEIIKDYNEQFGIVE